MPSLIDIVTRRRAASDDPAPEEPGTFEAEETGTDQLGEPEPEKESATEPAKPAAEAGAKAGQKPGAKTVAKTGGKPSASPAKSAAKKSTPSPKPGAKKQAASSKYTEKRPAAASVEGKGSRRLVIVLGVLTVVLGGLAAWFGTEASALRDVPAAHNQALTDTARTSEVKGQITDAVNNLFSYDFTDPGKTDQAARNLLTGKAVDQYDGMMASVRSQGPVQKLVLTTTVTDSAVELLNGDRARLLLFADQRSTRTTNKATTYSAAMLAVDAVRQGDTWKITNLDTLNAGR